MADAKECVEGLSTIDSYDYFTEQTVCPYVSYKYFNIFLVNFIFISTSISDYGITVLIFPRILVRIFFFFFFDSSFTPTLLISDYRTVKNE